MCYFIYSGSLKYERMFSCFDVDAHSYFGIYLLKTLHYEEY